jgi:hypothetical protein
MTKRPRCKARPFFFRLPRTLPPRVGTAKPAFSACESSQCQWIFLLRLAIWHAAITFGVVESSALAVRLKKREETMLFRTIAVVTITIALTLISPRPCHATYLGLATQLHTIVDVNGNLRAGYRIYAVFSNANDYLTSVAGSATLGPIVLQSLNAESTAPGGNFFDSASGTPGNMATNASASAIGTFMPSDSLFLTGNSYSNSNIVWFTLGPQEQGRAGGPNGVPLLFNGNPAMGVLVMQLAVPAGDNVAGTIAVGVSLAGSGGSTIANQAFTSVLVPGPGVLALFGFAGMIGRRRR